MRKKANGPSSKTRDTAVEDYADLKGPTLLKHTLGLQRRHHAVYVGNSGPFELALLPRGASLGQPIKSGIESKRPAFLDVGRAAAFILDSDQDTVRYDEEIGDLDAIENHVAPHGQALIDLYFRIVHPSFPILHKKVYLEKYDRSHREFSPVLLAAVYILALDYWNYSPDLASSRAPDVDFLGSKALKCMNDAIHRPKLSTVEAGLLLLQQASRNVANSTSSMSPWRWSLTSQMVAAGQDMGLHQDCSDWAIPRWEVGLRKRLAWALFMQDKWESLVHGRPSHISEKWDWAVADLTDDDFPENFFDENDEDGSTEVEMGKTLFMHMVSLTKILSDIVVDLYSMKADEQVRNSVDDPVELILMKAKPLLIRLKDWKSHLPGFLSIENIKFRKLSSSGYLHLSYWAAELLLHRRIVRSLPECTSRELFITCHKAASNRLKLAGAFVKNLRPEHWQSFWYFTSEYNFGLIGLVEVSLFSVCTYSKDLEASQNRLNDYLWTLRISRKTAEFLDKAIAIIDLAKSHARPHVEQFEEDLGDTSEGDHQEADESQNEKWLGSETFSLRSGEILTPTQDFDNLDAIDAIGAYMNDGIAAWH